MVTEPAKVILTLGIFGFGLSFLIGLANFYYGISSAGIIGFLISVYLIDQIIDRLDRLINLLEKD